MFLDNPPPRLRAYIYNKEIKNITNMNLSNIICLKDSRINCLSISVTTSIGEYVSWFTENGIENKLEEQRSILNTRSANTIRKRLIEDLEQGAVIPPIVLGISDENALLEMRSEESVVYINAHLSDATVIDGMQRSAALKEALFNNSKIRDNQIRLDFWVAKSTMALVYRMLVLNTGQTPWDIKRQMEVIYAPLIKDCKNKISEIIIYNKNDASKRKTGGEYQASQIAELFLAFASRKEIISTADQVADDFTKLDVSQMAGNENEAKIFYVILSLLCELDIAFSKYVADEHSPAIKFQDGKDLFNEQPAKIGFVVACAQYIFGRVGMKTKTIEEINEKVDELQTEAEVFIEGISSLDAVKIKDFLALDLLDEIQKSLPSKKIGDAQRNFYRQAFTTLIECNFGIDSMEVLWRS